MSSSSILLALPQTPAPEELAAHPSVMLQPRHRNRSDSVSSIALDCMLLMHPHSNQSSSSSLTTSSIALNVSTPSHTARASAPSSRLTDATNLEKGIADLSLCSIEETPTRSKENSKSVGFFTPPPGSEVVACKRTSLASKLLFSDQYQNTTTKRIRTSTTATTPSHSEQKLIQEAPRLPTSPSINDYLSFRASRSPAGTRRCLLPTPPPPELLYEALDVLMDKENKMDDIHADDRAPPPPPPPIMPAMLTSTEQQHRVNALKMRKAADPANALFAPFYK